MQLREWGRGSFFYAVFYTYIEDLCDIISSVRRKGTQFTLAYLRRTMNLQRYHSANLPELMKIISKNGIGMDDYLDRFFNSYENVTNYPPYNLIHVNNVE